MNNKIFEDSLQAIKDISYEEAIAMIDGMYDELKSTIDFEKIDYCMDRYINAEIDFQTPGDRGIGRMRDTIPRFGGYFRKQVSKLSSEDLEEIKSNLKQVLYTGYLIHIFLQEETLKDSKGQSSQELFKKWIPKIYVSKVENIPANLKNYLFGATSKKLMNLKKIMKKNGLVGGGIFGSDKTDMILTYYPIAGYGLRASE
jgi:hypothetical protein